MAEVLLYLGESGVGKTTSLRTLNAKNTVIISPNAKSLPFPGGDRAYTQENHLIRTNELNEVYGAMKHISDAMPEVNVVVMDDFFHFLSARMFTPTFLSRTDGSDAYAKWLELGADVFNTIFAHAQELRNDLYIIVMAHTAVNEQGKVTIKTAGKLLDNTIDIPSYFTYVFHGHIHETEQGPRYVMQTNWNSIYQAKTPLGAFSEMFIDNDMAQVILAIHNYRFAPAVESK